MADRNVLNQDNPVDDILTAAHLMRHEKDRRWHTVAEWLQSHARDLESAGGLFGMCDSPGDTETALKVARAFLDGTPGGVA